MDKEDVLLFHCSLLIVKKNSIQHGGTDHVKMESPAETVHFKQKAYRDGKGVFPGVLKKGNSNICLAAMGGSQNDWSNNCQNFHVDRVGKGATHRNDAFKRKIGKFCAGASVHGLAGQKKSPAKPCAVMLVMTFLRPIACPAAHCPAEGPVGRRGPGRCR